MHALQCECGETIPVALRQAGNELTCPACSQRIQVPKLGELRSLPEITPASPPAPVRRPISMGKRVTFAALGCLAGIGLLVGGFALIKAATIEVESTTEAHIANDVARLKQTPPGQVVSLWRDYMKYGLTERHPFPYQRHANEKAAWQRRGYIGLSVAAAAIVLAALVVRSGRSERLSAESAGTAPGAE